MKAIHIFTQAIFMILISANAFAQIAPDAKCEGYGFVRGTVDFAKCMQTETNKSEKKEQCEQEKRSESLTCFMRCYAKPGSYAGQCGGPCGQQAAQIYAQCMAN